MLKEEDLCPIAWPYRFYIDAFQELNTCRPQGVSVGPIPFSEICQYAKIYEVEDFQEFLYIVRQMDGEFLRLNNNKAKQDGKKSASKRNKS